ncbi:MAG: hypothetical protein DBX47_04420 [Clostridiales bacterium]|nr:MAG: hypothetical protein DBX47_04420 [Clostridiales bacterium]
MSFYNFKKDIRKTFNQKPALNIHIQSGEKIRCIGYLNKKSLAAEFIKFLPHGEILFIYSSESNKYDFRIIDITEIKHYIQMLNDEKINLPADKNIIFSKIFDKAIKLFGKMYCNKNKSFSTSVQILNSYYLKDRIEEKPVLTTLDDMPLNHEIFYAEAKYFIKKYIEYKLGNKYKKNKSSNIDFDILFLIYLKNWSRL